MFSEELIFSDSLSSLKKVTISQKHCSTKSFLLCSKTSNDKGSADELAAAANLWLAVFVLLMQHDTFL